LPEFSPQLPAKTQEKALRVILGAFFSNKSMLGANFAHIFMEFVKVFRDFARILKDFARILRDFARYFTKSKSVGVRLHPLQSRLLHQWFHGSIT